MSSGAADTPAAQPPPEQRRPGKVRRSAVASWVLWDFGATGLNALVITFVFSVYLTDAVGVDLPGGHHVKESLAQYRPQPDRGGGLVSQRLVCIEAEADADMVPRQGDVFDAALLGPARDPCGIFQQIRRPRLLGQRAEGLGQRSTRLV